MYYISTLCNYDSRYDEPHTYIHFKHEISNFFKDITFYLYYDILCIIVTDSQMNIAEDGDLDPLLKLLKYEDEEIKSLASQVIASLYFYGNISYHNIINFY